MRTHLFRLGGRDVGHPAVGFVRRDKAPQSFCDDYGAAESRALIQDLTDGFGREPSLRDCEQLIGSLSPR